MSATAAAFQRKPLVIDGNALFSGDMSTTFKAGSAESLMRTYLLWVRDMRGQRKAPSIHLRSEDVSVIASHLGVDDEMVLGGLLDLMGETRAGRSTVMALLAAGALTVTLSGAAVTSLSTDGVTVDFGRLVDAVQSVVNRDTPAVAQTQTQTSTQTQTQTPAVVTPSVSDAANTATDIGAVETTPVVVRPVAVSDPIFDTPSQATLQTAADVVAWTLASMDTTATAVQEPVAVGTASDGSTVGVVAPPVAPTVEPEPVAVGTAPDGSTVGVVAPPAVPVPAPSEPSSTGTAPDGSTVGVVAPPVVPIPVPSASGSSIGDGADGSTVGVAQPPVVNG